LLALAAFGAGVAALWRSAERARADADCARGDAETARDAEKVARGTAETARDAERQLREGLERYEYGLRMQVAHQAWRDNNLVVARAWLDSTKPELRGWEWGYVHRLCHAELLTLSGHTLAVRSASFSSDGTQIVTGSEDATARVWDAATGEPVTPPL